MTLQPDRIGFTFTLARYGQLVQSYDPSKGSTLINASDFARQGVRPSQYEQPVNRLFAYTHTETDRRVRDSCDTVIATLRNEMNDAKKSIDDRLTNEILQKIAKIFEEKSASGDARSIAQRFEAHDHDIREVKAEVVKQINGVLVEEVKKESQSEIATLRAELDASKAQVKTLEEQLKSLAAEVTKLKEQSAPK